MSFIIPHPKNRRLHRHPPYHHQIAPRPHPARRTIPHLQRTVNICSHEGVDRIVALGPDVIPRHSRSGTGSRTAGYSVCNECDMCLAGTEQLCDARKISGQDGGMLCWASTPAIFPVRPAGSDCVPRFPGDMKSDVLQTTAGGPHGVIVGSSSSAAYEQALAYRRPRCISPWDPRISSRGVRLTGSSTGTMTDTREALEYVRDGRVKPLAVETRMEQIEASDSPASQPTSPRDPLLPVAVPEPEGKVEVGYKAASPAII
ncbi:hypothetical protein BO71DRAFT_434302 [Aspergillus ellipticus CBS 707.79]|uniref:Uncharacterized protein n=1 Tax=Aspergillus ellipticus CBS 707.79 TaxID=1448320 RepID=A0A319EG91_9EURO|nr:hypothetical protein BO71DRAFT_434302 [Aspergillus ellipticus CBS 707.79]